MTILIGIDPGWKNLGLAVVDDNGDLRTKVMAPFKYATLSDVVEDIISFVALPTSGSYDAHLTIERYVAYAGVHNADSEYILMTMGAIVAEFQRREIQVAQVRAIEWKPFLCKRLFKEIGFRNPSKTFDKVYSLAAANALASQFKGTDHEADAICLAYVGVWVKIRSKSVKGSDVADS